MLGSVTVQIVCEWVKKFNAHGPDGLINRKAPSKPPKLTAEQLAALAAMAESGPIGAHDFRDNSEADAGSFGGFIKMAAAFRGEVQGAPRNSRAIVTDRQAEVRAGAKQLDHCPRSRLFVRIVWCVTHEFDEVLPVNVQRLTVWSIDVEGNDVAARKLADGVRHVADHGGDIRRGFSMA